MALPGRRKEKIMIFVGRLSELWSRVELMEKNDKPDFNEKKGGDDFYS